MFHFLKKKTFLALGVSLVLFSGVVMGSNVEVYKDPNPPGERPADMAPENKVIDPTEQKIQNVFGSLPKLEQYGILYYENNPDKVVIGFKETNEKTKAFITSMKQTIPSESLEIQNLQYSKNDLRAMLKDLAEYLKAHGLKDYFLMIVDEQQKIRLEIEQLSAEHQNILKTKFGEVLEIIIQEVPTFDPLIERKRSWNNLGGGIGIRLPEISSTAYCSTTGIGNKDTRWFIITAGHCIQKGNKYGYQYENIVGLDHHDARSAAGIDAGLIQITDDSDLAYSRYATNDFYRFAEDDTYYDAEISGVGWPAKGEYLEKSGVRTGVTYGYVEATDVYYTSGGYDLTGAWVKNPNGTKIADEGDSGAIAIAIPTEITIQKVSFLREMVAATSPEC